MILTVKDLSVSYGAITALRGINLHVERGHIVTLIGANGAGKTTLLRSISGLLRPRSGSITYQPGSPTSTTTNEPSSSSPKVGHQLEYAGSRTGSHELSKLSPHEIVGLGVIHVPEGRGIFANLTVAENLRLGAYLRRDTAEIDKDRERVLTTFPRLKERYKQSAGTLSGGEQQMLAIGRGLMARPTLLLLDEPSLGLAPRLVRQIFDTIVEINRQGVTILLIEQNAHMALNVAHHAFCLETGTIALSGPARELAAKDEVKQVYLGG